MKHIFTPGAAHAGMPLGPVTLRVDRELNELQRWGGLADRLAPGPPAEFVEPTVFCRTFLALLRDRWQTRPPFVHTRSVVETLKPIPLDTDIEITGSIARTYVRKGCDYIVVHGECRVDGELVSRQQNTFIAGEAFAP